MLVLSRKIGEQIKIGPNIVATVVRISKSECRIGIDAPADVPIVRAELEKDESCSQDLKRGVWFQAACSGLWYQNHRAAGDVLVVRVDGQDYLPMPYRLTSENGAKGLLSGEFSEGMEVTDEDGELVTQQVPVSWTTIKQIYNNAVRWFLHDKPRDAAQAEHERET